MQKYIDYKNDNNKDVNIFYENNYELNDTWCVYFHAKDGLKNYSDNTTKLIEFNDIKTFWKTFNNIPKPTDMFSEPSRPNKRLKRTNEIPNAISVFRKHSYPTWEDSTNQNGFEWSIRKYRDYYEFNKLWISLLTIVISEKFEHSEILNGVRIVDCSIDNKIMYRMEIWFSTKNYKDYFETKIKELLEIPLHTKFLYREHSCLKENKKDYYREQKKERERISNKEITNENE
jgi:hypothetical protein